MGVNLWLCWPGDEFSDREGEGDDDGEWEPLDPRKASASAGPHSQARLGVEFSEKAICDFVFSWDRQCHDFFAREVPLLNTLVFGGMQREDHRLPVGHPSAPWSSIDGVPEALDQLAELLAQHHPEMLRVVQAEKKRRQEQFKSWFGRLVLRRRERRQSAAETARRSAALLGELDDHARSCRELAQQMRLLQRHGVTHYALAVD